MPAMAYSPIEQGRFPSSGALAKIAKDRGSTVPQIALAWLLRRGDLIVIPKASAIEHVRQNREALAIVLSSEELGAIDAAFPPPGRKVPLDML
jgi:diketogulonate reductase-like aldo/keto reductase